MILRVFIIRLIRNLKKRWALAMKIFVMPENLLMNKLWNIRRKRKKEERKRKFIRQKQEEY
jgi:hypothetical protein